MNISIHALLAESDQPGHKGGNTMARISIHALLAESDRSNGGTHYSYIRISIHALLAESDYLTNYHFTVILRFLSTLSLRRATVYFL